jgi:hypothetical protein
VLFTGFVSEIVATKFEYPMATVFTTAPGWHSEYGNVTLKVIVIDWVAGRAELPKILMRTAIEPLGDPI